MLTNFSVLGDLQIIFLSLIVSYIVWYLIRFYRLVAQLPKGPFPLPIFGNFIFLIKGRFSSRNTVYQLIEFHDKYGPAYTLWLFNQPLILIGDTDLAREVLGQKSNNGRSVFTALKVMTDGRGDGLVFQDSGPAWACNRKIALNALRKFIVSDKLPVFVNDSVSRVLTMIKLTEGYDQPFDINEFVFKIIINITSSSTFGKSYKLDDPELVKLTHYFDMIESQFDFLVMADGLPRFLIPIFINIAARNTVNGFKMLNKLCQAKIKEHIQDYEEGVIRDYADSLISAKNEAIEEGKESTVYLTDRNLGNVLSDLFFAGIDTTGTVLVWCFLFLTKYPEMQIQMRKEIKEAIGNRVPVQDDKNNCHLTMAFIAKVLRLRDMPMWGVPHATRAETKIVDCNVPDGILITPFTFGFGNSDKFWPNAKQFVPKRFLDKDGHFIANDKPSAFMPFGGGRRVCPGERLAWVDLFLILANVFRNTDGYVFEFVGEMDKASTEPAPGKLTMCQAKPFQVKLVKT